MPVPFTVVSDCENLVLSWKNVNTLLLHSKLYKSYFFMQQIDVYHERAFQ